MLRQKTRAHDAITTYSTYQSTTPSPKPREATVHTQFTEAILKELKKYRNSADWSECIKQPRQSIRYPNMNEQFKLARLDLFLAQHVI